jgi:hypothetical protein
LLGPINVSAGAKAWHDRIRGKPVGTRGLSNEPKNIKIGSEMKEIWLKHCFGCISLISGSILMFLGSLESPCKHLTDPTDPVVKGPSGKSAYWCISGCKNIRVSSRLRYTKEGPFSITVYCNFRYLLYDSNITDSQSCSGQRVEQQHAGE